MQAGCKTVNGTSQGENPMTRDAKEPSLEVLQTLLAFAERGEVTVAHIADLMVSHDRTHLGQIREGLSEE